MRVRRGYPADEIVRKDATRPGMLLVDAASVSWWTTKSQSRLRQPRRYGEWLPTWSTWFRCPGPEAHSVCPKPHAKTSITSAAKASALPAEDGLPRGSLAGWRNERAEPAGAMGSDARAGRALRYTQRPLSEYFQADVSPRCRPIDALREKVVTSTTAAASRPGQTCC